MIDSRRSPSVLRREQRGQRAGGIAAHCDDRMEQAVHRKPARREGGGDRIDQERHVVVDDREPHQPPPALAADRFEREAGLAGRAPHRRLRDERRGRATRGVVEAVGLAGQRALRQHGRDLGDERARLRVACRRSSRSPPMPSLRIRSLRGHAPQGGRSRAAMRPSAALLNPRVRPRNGRADAASAAVLLLARRCRISS